MNSIKVDFLKVTGPVKPMHAVGQPPYPGINDAYLHYLTEAHIPYSRLHDMGGNFGANLFVDIPNIFREFDADVDDPTSYDFVFTDKLISDMMKAKVMPIFRLGVTIENYMRLKAYRIHPPKDFRKWAAICEHIIRHYNEGWADGFRYGIEYWEIWNEPENQPDPSINEMWTGTKEQYFELYDITSKHLKKSFGDSIKVGGFASCGFYQILANPRKYGIDCNPTIEATERFEYMHVFAIDFFRYIREHASPLDFFSWHSYSSTEETVIMTKYLDGLMDKFGYAGVETMLNEWNNANGIENLGTSYASAMTTSMMIAMQHTTCGMLCYYDARMGAGAYAGMFNGYTRKPVSTYYAIKSFGELFVLGKEAELKHNVKDVYAMAATDGKGKNAVLITNVSKGKKKLNLEGVDGYQVYLTDEKHFLEKIDRNSNEMVLKGYETVLLTNFSLYA